MKIKNINAMSELKVRHVATKLKKLYKDKIDVEDSLARTEHDKELCFLSRAYAAYSLQVLASVSEDEAAESITDGINDNGIDAVCFDKISKILWLVQSKWKQKGVGEPELGDTLKFCTGIKKIIEDDFSVCNPKILKRREMIEDALNDYTVKIHIILAYTGDEKLSSHNLDAINRLLGDLNGDSEELASFETFSLNKAHQALAGLVVGKPISEEFVIENFGKIDTPFKSIYGCVNGSLFAQLWEKYRSRLFSENIRGFLGDSSVNEDVKNTILNSPNNFFYYNNGITILCDSFTKKPLSQQNAGTFDIKNLKIVNGAQTVGSIGRAYEYNPESVAEINVFVKVISLENCPEGFGDDVTKKTNTQNKIEKRDFVSLDSEQERLKTELAIIGVNYYIKRSNDVSTDMNSCTVEDLMVAVACSLNDVDLAVIAKREVGLLWNNIHTTPYTEIVKSGLSATKAWKCIQIMRSLSDYIKTRSKNEIGRKKMCLIHSNRFVLFILLNQNNTLLADDQQNIDSYLKTLIPQAVCLHNSNQC